MYELDLGINNNEGNKDEINRKKQKETVIKTQHSKANISSLSSDGNVMIIAGSPQRHWGPHPRTNDALKSTGMTKASLHSAKQSVLVCEPEAERALTGPSIYCCSIRALADRMSFGP